MPLPPGYLPSPSLSLPPPPPPPPPPAPHKHTQKKRNEKRPGTYKNLRDNYLINLTAKTKLQINDNDII